MNSQASSHTYTYGYLPSTFPRDPVEVNQIAEHTLLGQILEPLIETDSAGNLVPCLASNWTFGHDGKTLGLEIRRDRVFSDGRRIAAQDVAYTINRMLMLNGQSAHFLKSVQQVTVPDEYHVTLILKTQDVSILKVLSRDQMGILPNEWVYDASSDEPIIGSGPYRLRRMNGEWHFVSSPSCPSARNNGVSSWRLIRSTQALRDINGNLPDYIPNVSEAMLARLSSEPEFSQFQITQQPSYLQSSAWWHPSGPHFSDRKARAFIMSIVESAFRAATDGLQMQRATGVIPLGIDGAIPQHTEKPASTPMNPGLPTVNIAVSGNLFDPFIHGEWLRTFAAPASVNFNIHRIAVGDFGNLQRIKPDVLFAAWAGGFKDPEGFLGVLPGILGQELLDYIGAEMASIYGSAKGERNPVARGDLFRKINKGLRDNWLMVPGWRNCSVTLAREELRTEGVGDRFTVRLSGVKGSSQR